MRDLKALYTSARVKWATPKAVYAELDAEFGFTMDPCPIDWEPETHPDGLALDWRGHRVFCNPPYGRGVDKWLAKASEADLAVYLLPARTDTKWWHEHATKANDTRFIRGRLKYGDGPQSAPFPSVVLVYRKEAA